MIITAALILTHLSLTYIPQILAQSLASRYYVLLRTNFFYLTDECGQRGLGR